MCSLNKQLFEVVDIQLQEFRRFLHAEIDPSKVTRLFRMQRILSPRAAAETISEAHRLWATELSAVHEIGSSKNEFQLASFRRRYETDLRRIDDIRRICRAEGSLLTLETFDETCYPLRLYHFEKAIQALESGQERQRRDLEEALIPSTPTPGVSFGLYATDKGTGGIIIVECSVRPIIPSERQVSVTGNSTSVVVGQSVVPDESVYQSAQNATEALRSWLWRERRIDLSRLPVHFQIRSVLEGSVGHGVSGPSAGLPMILAFLSELSGMPVSNSIVATGTIGVKLDVGPVGGLGGSGTQTGKIVGILKSRRIHVADFVLPIANYQTAADEMQVLIDESVRVHPISSVTQCIRTVFGLSEREIIDKIEGRVETAVRPSQLA